MRSASACMLRGRSSLARISRKWCAACVFVAAPQAVNLGARHRRGVLVVGLAGEALIEERLVVVPPAGHRDVQHGPRGALTEDGVAALGGHTLRRVHRGGVSQGDMLTQIVTFEHHPRLVGDAFGGKAVGLRVDRGDAPAVAVADLVDALAAAVPGAGAQLDGDVVGCGS